MINRMRPRARTGQRVRRTLLATIAVMGSGAVLGTVGAAAASADTLTATSSAATFGRGIPETLTFASNAGAIDTSGDGPYLYALVQPTSAGACQSTYGGDLQVVGSQATLLESTPPRVNTGTDSHSFSYTSYAPDGYTACAWLENDASDHAGKGDTTANVTATATVDFTVTDDDTLATTLSNTNPAPKAPFTLTVTGSDTPISPGSGPFLYVVRQPVASGACGATYGTDRQVVGGQAEPIAVAQEVNTGTFSLPFSETSQVGQFEICSWLETDNNDFTTKGDTASVVTATAGPVSYDVVAPKTAGSTTPKLTAVTISGLATAKPKLRFSAASASADISSLKVILPKGIDLATSRQTLLRYMTVTSGFRRIGFSVTRSGSTLTITPHGRVAKLSVTLGARALTETAGLRASVRSGRTTAVSLTFKVAATVGGTTTRTVRLRV